MGPFIYQSSKNGSIIFSFLGKRGLIVLLAVLKKGAIRAAYPYHVIYRELPTELLFYFARKASNQSRTNGPINAHLTIAQV